MKLFRILLTALGVFMLAHNAAAAVKIGCDPCIVDPCKLAPERCNPPGGGPINK
jgi:hypothetical protein